MVLTVLKEHIPAHQLLSWPGGVLTRALWVLLSRPSWSGHHSLGQSPGKPLWSHQRQAVEHTVLQATRLCLFQTAHRYCLSFQFCLCLTMTRSTWKWSITKHSPLSSSAASALVQEQSIFNELAVSSHLLTSTPGHINLFSLNLSNSALKGKCHI